MAIAFAREGADMALSYLESEEADASETAGWVTAAGQQAALLIGDLNDHHTVCTHGAQSKLQAGLMY